MNSCYFYTFWQSSYPALTLTLFTHPHSSCWLDFSPFPPLLGHRSLSNLNAHFQNSLAHNLNFSSFPCSRSWVFMIPLLTYNLFMNFVLFYYRVIVSCLWQLQSSCRYWHSTYIESRTFWNLPWNVTLSFSHYYPISSFSKFRCSKFIPEWFCSTKIIFLTKWENELVFSVILL